MLKSCKYCGHIHPSKYECPHKPKPKREKTDIARFRSSGEWTAKSAEIRDRDGYMCQACLREYPGTMRKYNAVGISVHHIVPLSVAWEKRLDDDNLITLCGLHHKMAERGEIKADELRRMIPPLPPRHENRELAKTNRPPPNRVISRNER